LEFLIQNWAVIALSSAIGGLGIAAQRYTRCWSHPAVAFCVFWFALSMLPILGAPEAHASPAAVAYILLSLCAFTAPVLIFEWRSAKEMAAKRASDRSTDWPLWLLWVAAAIPLATLFFMVNNLAIQGYSFDRLVSDPVEVGCLYMAQRYLGQVTPNAFNTASLVLNYVGAPLAGIVITSRRPLLLRLAIAVAAVAPSLAMVFVYADKGTVLLSGAYMFGGVLVGRVFLGNTQLVNRNTIVAGIVALAILLPTMMLAMLNRGDGACEDQSRNDAIFATLGSTLSVGNSNPDLSEEEIEERSAGMAFFLRSYALSHLFAFSHWFDTYISSTGTVYNDEASPTFGFWTFMAIGEIALPDKEVPAGYYNEYFEEPGVLKSNIYTMYRGLIYDFGVFGSLAFMALLGACTSAAYREMLQRAHAPMAQAFTISIFGFMYSSYLISIGTWASVYLAAAIILALLVLARATVRQKLPAMIKETP
jgi:hypothetical protein